MCLTYLNDAYGFAQAERSFLFYVYQRCWQRGHG